MQTNDVTHQAQLLKVLSHSKRLEIISLLRGHTLTVGQIVSMTALRQSAVSQHLHSLKELGLVGSTVRGKEIYYRLHPSTIEQLASTLKDLTRTTSPLEPSVTDPVCQMVLSPTSARYTTTYNGVCHYFCGRGCYQSFLKGHK